MITRKFTAGALGASFIITATCFAFAQQIQSAAPPFDTATTHRVKGSVAEIVAASPDEKTLVYTDSGAKQIGWVDISNPQKPSESTPLEVGGEPTSVDITPDGKWALCVVRDIRAKPGGGASHLLLVCEMSSQRVARRIELGGRPDCIKMSSDGKYAAIAIENERHDMKSPMPQSPAGWLTIIDLGGAPATWKLRRVSLVNTAERFASDPEPEYIAINDRNQAAVTLQENNAVVIVDLPTGDIIQKWSCGTTSHRADLKDDGIVALTDDLTNARREPDGLAWTPNGNIITANEGDYPDDLKKKKNEFGGGRNFSIFSPQGEILFDGNDLETEAAYAGVYDDKRSRKRGVEPENVVIARFGSRTFAFVGCENGHGA
ncbi:MAG TPA: hypothetical protein VF719_01385, partial [Abditibacteriaceae bacterium]